MKRGKFLRQVVNLEADNKFGLPTGQYVKKGGAQ